MLCKATIPCLVWMIFIVQKFSVLTFDLFKVMLSNLAINTGNQNAQSTLTEVIVPDTLKKVKTLTELLAVSTDLLVEETKEQSSSLRITCKVCSDFIQHSTINTR